MTRWTGVSLSLVALLGSGGCRCSEPPPVELSVSEPSVRRTLAQLGAFTGAVTVERQGVTSEAHAGPLEAGDVLRVPAEGRAELRLPDGRTFEAGSGSRIRLALKEGSLELEVLEGTVRSRTPAGFAKAVEQGVAVTVTLLTPEGVTRLGAEAGEVEVSVGDVVRVDVRMGKVEFITLSGERTAVGDGEKLTVVAGKVEVLSRAARVEVVLAPVEVLARTKPGGRAEVQKAGTQAWRPLGQAGGVLGPQDVLRAKKGWTSLSWGTSRSTLSVEAGAELRFGEAGAADAKARTEMDLVKGGLAMQVEKGHALELRLLGLHVTSPSGGNVLIHRVKEGYDVEAQVGDAELSRGALRETLPAGSRAKLRGDAPAKVEPLAQAALELPSKKGLKVFHSSLTELSLSWDGEGDNFWVEVAKDADFQERILEGVVHRPSVNVPAAAKGWLHWRVRSVDGNQELAQGSVQLGPEPQRKDLATLRNEVPDGAEKTTIYFQDKVPALTLLITPQEGADRYRLLIFRAEALGTPSLERWVKEPRAVLEPGALSEGEYVWSATPVDAAGKPLRAGRMTPLAIVYDNAVNSLVIHSPKAFDRLSSERKVTAAGVAPLGARVYVNGESAPLDDKHRFKVDVAPLEPSPLVVFRMARAGVPDVYTVRPLRRGR